MKLKHALLGKFGAKERNKSQFHIKMKNITKGKQLKKFQEWYLQRSGRKNYKYTLFDNFFGLKT